MWARSSSSRGMSSSTKENYKTQCVYLANLSCHNQGRDHSFKRIHSLDTSSAAPLQRASMWSFLRTGKKTLGPYWLVRVLISTACSGYKTFNIRSECSLMPMNRVTCCCLGSTSPSSLWVEIHRSQIWPYCSASGYQSHLKNTYGANGLWNGRTLNWNYNQQGCEAAIQCRKLNCQNTSGVLLFSGLFVNNCLAWKVLSRGLPSVWMTNTKIILLNPIERLLNA